MKELLCELILQAVLDLRRTGNLPAGAEPVFAIERTRQKAHGDYACNVALLLAKRLGERGFRALFSVLSLAALLFLVDSYRKAAFYPLWFSPKAIHWLPLFVMPLSLVLVVGAFSVPNATANVARLLMLEPSVWTSRQNRYQFIALVTAAASFVQDKVAVRLSRGIIEDAHKELKVASQGSSSFLV